MPVERTGGPIDLAHCSDFDLGPVTVAPSLRKVRGPLGESIIEPKVMQVLVALADPVGRINSRDDLIERCWDGRVVGDSSINRVISLLRTALKQAAGDDVQLENVPKVGYRLVVGDSAEPVATPGPRTVAPLRERRRVLPLAAGVLVTLMIAVIGWAWWQGSSDTPVSSVSIAVLPLEHSEGVDPVYAKGLESELRSQFARIGAIEAIGGDSTRALAEEGVAPQEIGKRLQVDYVWSGKLDLTADRVAINGRMIATENGEPTWSDAISSAPDAAQHIPLRTARAVATALGLPISREPPDDNVTASGFRLYLSAMGLLRNRGEQDRETALTILKDVTQANPDFADGWAGLSKAYYLSSQARPQLEGGNWGEARRIGEHALSLDPNSVDALKVVGSLVEDPRDQLRMLQRAVELDPGDAEALLWLSFVESFNYELGTDHVDTTMRLVAADPLWPGTWRASDLLAVEARLDLAREVERDILAASVTSSQRDLANARLAKLDGDLSRFLALSRRASNTQTAAERLYGSSVGIDVSRYLLGLSINDDSTIFKRSPPQLLRKLIEGELPLMAEFDRAGMGGADFWNSPDVLQFAVPLFLANGRDEDLLDLYDAAFEDHSAFVEFAERTQVPHEVIPTLSPLLASAMRTAGRDREAELHLASAEEQMRWWKKTGSNNLLPVVYEIQLATAKGELDRAARQVEKLPDYAWPYVLSHFVPIRIGLIGEDPFYDDLRAQPRVRAVLDPIRANIAKERAEALALGFD